ncbi:NAD(P)-dependent oxidoreductase [Mangrovimicrobium sediminis]|uniref:NAD(P)-dependent oxidoreductase n=1 Tax=Mangrovimicrobium sediminis TaxID=2562682 RepID=A0A4Z0M234_9GAMM|nr:NAD(P)-dependent oxidoreductase [Haliea sp. SAOS-164]TGD73494.1 NAD(P)-dependent oxidoreductase [Haliea sp. SAOS-164]
MAIRAGFIGLGSQGAPMARRMLDAGYDLVLWARRPQTLEPFQSTAARFAGSVAELGEQVDYCAICVVDDAGVRQIVDELLPAMAPGSLLVIHSTISPALCATLAQEAAVRSVHLIDAPVSGGGEGAAAGTLTVMLGGAARDVERARPLLETFAGQITHLGGVGSGQLAKLVNNTLMAANLALAHHALECAVAAGIDRAAFAQLVGVSSGRSFAFDVCARMPEPAAFAHGAKLLAKDVGLLGEALGDEANYQQLRDTAMRFLQLAQ